MSVPDRGYTRVRDRTYLTSEHTTVEPDVPTDFNQFDICGNLLAHGNMYEVTRNESRSWHSDLVAIAEHNDVRGEHALDRGHHSRRREVLPSVENGL